MQIWKPTELNFEGLKTQKWNLPMDRAEREDKKSGAICLFIMFTTRVMAFKISKMSHFFHFLLITAKNLSVWAKYLSAYERSCLILSENDMDY